MSIELLSNPSFEGGWIDQLPYGGRLTNQCPIGYNLYVRLPGTRLVSADTYHGPDDLPIYDTVAVVPECVHKLRAQLPDADELILGGDITFKVFAATNPFSVDLIAQVLITRPGELQITVPVQVHNHGDGSPGAAVARLIVNDDEGEWFTFGDGFKDREWCWLHGSSSMFDVLPGRVVTAILQMESRALGGIDFFTDAWSFEFTPDDPEEPEDPIPSGWTAGREQYERTYVLMPPLCGEEWPKSALAATWNERRFTIGGSADDAGIGPKVRTVIAVNPDQWTDDLGDFFARHYAGIVSVSYTHLTLPTTPYV